MSDEYDTTGTGRSSGIMTDGARWLPPPVAPAPHPQLALAPPPPQPTITDFLLKVAMVVGGTVVVHKVGQAMFDEDFGGRRFPDWFRQEKIREHRRTNGRVCPACGYEVRVRDLTVDHIVPHAKGGLTSRSNAAVICGSCNSRKRDQAGLLDCLRGRSL